MDAWSNVQEADVELGTIRVWQPQEGDTKQRISLVLPQNPGYKLTGEEADEYDLDLLPGRVENSYVIEDREKSGQKNPRVRSTRLAGRVHHKGSLKRAMTAAYEANIKKRHLQANQPKKQLIKLWNKDGDIGTGKTNLKMAQSGAKQVDATFAATNRRPGKAGGSFERNTRVARDELLDLIFPIFAENDYVSMRELRRRTEQPEAYLKEVMNELGVLHKSGPNANMWSLKQSFLSTLNKTRVGGTASTGGSTGGTPGGPEEGPSGSNKMEEDVDDDDDNDDDMEEVEA
jgi:transcription initiation factor TFIIF subunit beta